MTEFNMPDQTEPFEKRGAWVIKHLMIDVAPLEDFQAAGIVGNLGGESGMLPVNERHPLVPGSRGGWSWAQWTGVRRTEFEAFAGALGLDISSDEAAYRFLVEELLGSENRALQRLRKTKSLDDAVYIFEVAFERPSDPKGGLPSRLRFARRALDYYRFNGRVEAPRVATSPLPPPPPLVFPPPPPPFTWWQSLLQALGWTK